MSKSKIFCKYQKSLIQRRLCIISYIYGINSLNIVQKYYGTVPIYRYVYIISQIYGINGLNMVHKYFETVTIQMFINYQLDLRYTSPTSGGEILWDCPNLEIFMHNQLDLRYTSIIGGITNNLNLKIILISQIYGINYLHVEQKYFGTGPIQLSMHN